MRSVRWFAGAAVILALSLGLPGPARAVTMNFDTFPDSTPVPNGTVITAQYSSLGVTFSSSAGGPRAVVGLGEASSLPNFLIGNPDSFTPIAMDFSAPYSGDVHVTLISVGDATVTALALAGDLITVLDSESVSNPGTGVGLMNKDPITLSGSGISRVTFAITTPAPGDGFGIDDVRFAVPEPAGLLLLGSGLAALAALTRRRP